MNDSKQYFVETLSQIESEGLYKKERTITTPQGVGISTQEGAMFSIFAQIIIWGWPITPI
jgi:hypothetical protein